MGELWGRAVISSCQPDIEADELQINCRLCNLARKDLHDQSQHPYTVNITRDPETISYLSLCSLEGPERYSTLTEIYPWTRWMHEVIDSSLKNRVWLPLMM